MRVIGIVLAAAVMSTGVSAAWAQQPTAQTMKTFATFASSADVQNLIANAKKIRTPDQPMVSQPIVQLAPYRANLEYRPAVGPASIHEKEAELFYVIEGAGTLMTGGKLVNEKRTNAENLSGTALEGGTPQAVSKGDVFIVPENTGHWFSEIKSPIVVMSLHVPRSGAK
jgi:mannose-6-phosphate isomerase-like protein (cupin superfamily)